MAAIKESPGSQDAQVRQALEAKARHIFVTAFPGSRAEIGWTPSGRILGGFFGLGWIPRYG
jgi:hypothetical protein